MKATVDGFKKLDVRIGKIKRIEHVSDTDKLLCLEVDSVEGMDEGGVAIRCQIIYGMAEYFEDVELLAGRRCLFAANLGPKTIRGFENKGIIPAVSADYNTFSLFEPKKHIPIGSTVK